MAYAGGRRLDIRRRLELLTQVCDAVRHTINAGSFTAT